MAISSFNIDKNRYFTRHYVYLLVGLVLLMAMFTIGFIRWQDDLFIKVETETYEYHLSTMLSCAKVAEVVRRLEYDHQANRISQDGAGENSSHMYSDHVNSHF